MKKIYTTFILSVWITIISMDVVAQSSVSFSASQLYTSFRFDNSMGDRMNSEYNGIFTGSYGVDYRYITNFDMIVKSGIAMRNAGSTLVYDDMNYSWKLQYADLDLGLGYIYRGMKTFQPYFVCAGYYGYMLRGTQTLNNEDFNIIEGEFLNRSDYGIIFSPGLEVKLSQNLSAFLEYSYQMGLANIEPEEGQKARNFATGISLGINFNFSGK